MPHPSLLGLAASLPPMKVLCCSSDSITVRPLIRLGADLSTPDAIKLVYFLRLVDDSVSDGYRLKSSLANAATTDEVVVAAEDSARSAFNITMRKLLARSTDVAHDIVRVAADQHAALILLDTTAAVLASKIARGRMLEVLDDAPCPVGIYGHNGLAIAQRIVLFLPSTPAVAAPALTEHYAYAVNTAALFARNDSEVVVTIVVAALAVAPPPSSGDTRGDAFELGPMKAAGHMGAAEGSALPVAMPAGLGAAVQTALADALRLPNVTLVSSPATTLGALLSPEGLRAADPLHDAVSGLVLLPMLPLIWTPFAAPAPALGYRQRANTPSMASRLLRGGQPAPCWTELLADMGVSVLLLHVRDVAGGSASSSNTSATAALLLVPAAAKNERPDKSSKV